MTYIFNKIIITAKWLWRAACIRSNCFLPSPSHDLAHSFLPLQGYSWRSPHFYLMPFFLFSVPKSLPSHKAQFKSNPPPHQASTTHRATFSPRSPQCLPLPVARYWFLFHAPPRPQYISLMSLLRQSPLFGLNPAYPLLCLPQHGAQCWAHDKP